MSRLRCAQTAAAHAARRKRLVKIAAESDSESDGAPEGGAGGDAPAAEEGESESETGGMEGGALAAEDSESEGGALAAEESESEGGALAAGGGSEGEMPRRATAALRRLLGAEAGDGYADAAESPVCGFRLQRSEWEAEQRAGRPVGDWEEIVARHQAVTAAMRRELPSPYEILALDLPLPAAKTALELLNQVLAADPRTEERYALQRALQRHLDAARLLPPAPSYAELVQKIVALPAADAGGETAKLKLFARAAVAAESGAEGHYALRELAAEIADAEHCGESGAGPTELRQRIEAHEGLSPQQRRALLRELQHLGPGEQGEERMNWVRRALQIPFGKFAAPPVSAGDGAAAFLAQVRADLDQAYFGAKEVKDRLMEFIAAYIRKPEAPGAVLAFCGPPGTGKSALAGIVAQALGRKLHRISAGSLTDASRVRGSGSVWLGAQPGAPVLSMIAAGEMNPVVVVDEVDKASATVLGALIHYCDPTESAHLVDEYFDHLGPVDASRQIKILICNEPELPELHVLLNRAELFHFQAYNAQDKLAIASQLMLPQLLEGAGVTDVEFEPAALSAILAMTAPEKGVRRFRQALQRAVQKANLLLLTGRLRAPVVVRGELRGSEAAAWREAEAGGAPARAVPARALFAPNRAPAPGNPLMYI